MYIIIAHITFGGDSTPYRAVFHHNAKQYLHIRPLSPNGVYETHDSLFGGGGGGGQPY